MKSWIALALVATTAAAAAAATPTTTQASSRPSSGPAHEAMADLQLSPLVEKVPGGRIDWTRGEIFAVGSSPLQNDSGQAIDMAKRGARLIAARNAVLALGGIRSGPGGTFKSIQEGTLKVDAVLKDIEEVSSGLNSRGTRAVVRVRLPLYGVRGVLTISGMEVTPHPAAIALGNAEGSTHVRTIVIDARGSGFRPCAFPRLVDSKKRLVHVAVRRDKGVVQPAALLATAGEDVALPPTAAGDLRNAKTTRLVLRAHIAKGGTIVLKESDVKLLGQVPRAALLLREELVIVADAPAPVNRDEVTVP